MKHIIALFFSVFLCAKRLKSHRRRRRLKYIMQQVGSAPQLPQNSALKDTIRDLIGLA